MIRNKLYGRQKTKILVYALFASFLISIFVLRIVFKSNPFEVPKSQSVTLEVLVKSEPKYTDKYQIIKVGDGSVYASLFPKYEVGDLLKIEGKSDEEGRFFYADVEKIGHRSSYGADFSNLRGKIAQNVETYLPPREAALVVGSVLGVNKIGEEFKNELIKTGTIHVVVVSGQNLMIVAGIFLALTKYLGRRLSTILATCAVFFYAVLTGFEPPVVRASLMVLAATFALFFGREIWPLWNILLAAAIIVFVWPAAILEVSFQLTFAATVGIVTLGRNLAGSVTPQVLDSRFPACRQAWRGNDKKKEGAERNSFKKMLKQVQHDKFVSGLVGVLKNNAAVATSAYLFTAPIILFYFGKISPIAPVVNILVAELIFPIMVLGFLVSILSLIFSPLAQLIAYVVYIPAHIFVKIVEISSNFSGQIELTGANLAIVLGSYILLINLVFVMSRRRS